MLPNPAVREANGRVNPPAHFFEHDKTVAAAQSTAGRPGRTTWPGRRGFTGLGRVSAGRDGFLQLLDIGQLRFARRHRLRGADVRRLIGEELRGHLQAAVTPEGQFLAIFQMNGHCAFGSGNQLLAGEQSIALDQRTPGAIARNREHLTNDFTDDTDERSHVHFLRCQQLSSASCLSAKNVLMVKSRWLRGSPAGRVYRSKPPPWR